MAKEAEGKPVQRLVYFVSGIHPQAAAKAEHILCSPDPQATFKAVYAGAQPASLLKCRAGAEKVSRDADTVRQNRQLSPSGAGLGFGALGVEKGLELCLLEPRHELPIDEKRRRARHAHLADRVRVA